MKKSTRKIATEIVECINQTSNDYDAIEQTIEILKQYYQKDEPIQTVEEIL